MENWVDRYVAAVVGRLPEKERAEVSEELKANIYDMLPDGASENEVKTVLNGLGSPAILAEKYRPNPRYLISPLIYNDYIRILKWIVPLVGCIMLVIGAILGATDAIKDSMIELSEFVKNIFAQGISLGVSGAFQALVWTTVGFVIAERAGMKTKLNDKIWTVEELPKSIPNNKGKIPLSDTIVEMVVITVFALIAVAFCLGFTPLRFTIQYGDTQINQLFSDSFLATCAPIIIIGALLGIAECIVKIVKRRWTPIVCGTIVVSNLIGIGLMLYLFTRPEIFSPEFAVYLQAQDWWTFDMLRFMGSAIENPIIFGGAAIVIICSLAECVSAIYRTIKASKSEIKPEPNAV